MRSPTGRTNIPGPEMQRLRIPGVVLPTTRPRLALAETDYAGLELRILAYELQSGHRLTNPCQEKKR